jgi:hypothetical protein
MSPQVQEELRRLPRMLYSGNYFSYPETAESYVVDLVAEIIRSLPFRPSRKAPLRYRRYGKNLRYVLIRRSKHTQWYVFFNTYQDGAEIVYVVRLIRNNHVVGKHLRFPSPA